MRRDGAMLPQLARACTHTLWWLGVSSSRLVPSPPHDRSGLLRLLFSWGGVQPNRPCPQRSTACVMWRMSTARQRASNGLSAPCQDISWGTRSPALLLPLVHYHPHPSCRHCASGLAWPKPSWLGPRAVNSEWICMRESSETVPAVRIRACACVRVCACDCV